MKRGAVKKDPNKSRPILVWFPIPLLVRLDEGVAIEDADRSKFIRNAVREKLSKIRLDLEPVEAGK